MESPTAAEVEKDRNYAGWSHGEISYVVGMNIYQPHLPFIYGWQKRQQSFKANLSAIAWCHLPSLTTVLPMTLAGPEPKLNVNTTRPPLSSKARKSLSNSASCRARRTLASSFSDTSLFSLEVFWWEWDYCTCVNHEWLFWHNFLTDLLNLIYYLMKQKLKTKITRYY